MKSVAAFVVVVVVALSATLATAADFSGNASSTHTEDAVLLRLPYNQVVSRWGSPRPLKFSVTLNSTARASRPSVKICGQRSSVPTMNSGMWSASVCPLWVTIDAAEWPVPTPKPKAQRRDALASAHASVHRFRFLGDDADADADADAVVATGAGAAAVDAADDTYTISGEADVVSGDYMWRLAIDNTPNGQPLAYDVNVDFSGCLVTETNGAWGKLCENAMIELGDEPTTVDRAAVLYTIPTAPLGMRVGNVRLEFDVVEPAAKPAGNTTFYVRDGALPDYTVPSTYVRVQVDNAQANTMSVELPGALTGRPVIVTAEPSANARPVRVRATVTEVCDDDSIGPACRVVTSLPRFSPFESRHNVVAPTLSGEVNHTAYYYYFNVSNAAKGFKNNGTLGISIQAYERRMPGLSIAFESWPGSSASEATTALAVADVAFAANLADVAYAGDKQKSLSSKPVTNMVTFSDLADGQWVVAVFGPEQPTNTSVPVAVWSGTACPGNCSNTDKTTRGTCNADTHVCDCDLGYEGFDCASQSNAFKTEYVVLIVIGGIIVAAMVVGLAVFFFNKRHRSGYEKV